MDAISLLHSRCSMPKLMEPAPTTEELEILFKAALRAPDHAWLRPWRFLLIDGDKRHQLGELFAQAALSRDMQLSEAELDKFRNQPLRAPLLVVVIANIRQHPKVPREEQLMSAGCAAHGLLLAAYALGYAGIWRTGSHAYDQQVKQGLKLAEHEDIVGFVYLGTANGALKKIPDLTVTDYVQQWQPDIV